SRITALSNPIARCVLPTPVGPWNTRPFCSTGNDSTNFLARRSASRCESVSGLYVVSSARANLGGMRASARFFWITTERQQSQRVNRSTPSTVTLFQRVPWQISQSIGSVEIAEQDAVLANHVQIAGVGLSAPACLAERLAPALVVQMRRKVLRIRDGRLLDLFAGGRRLRVFKRHANGI